VPNFIARIELHSADYTDYENLHSYAQQRGYLRTIKGDGGKSYQLPTGTYISAGALSTGAAALQAAVAAADATKRASCVIVAEWSSATWQGLQAVNGTRTA
jgi:hypothetical protein